MALTQDEFDEIVKLICPHCRGGHQAVTRPETGERVHNQSTQLAFGGSSYSHSLCWADGLYRSRFNPANAT